MKRKDLLPRLDFRDKIASLGLVWDSEVDPYWNESACYSFTSEEIAKIEAATGEMHQMFIAATEHIIENKLLSRFDIPEMFHQKIIEDWNNDNLPLLNVGRFDFGFDGTDLKLFEYNADTPTSLLEAAVVQWQWKEEAFPNSDQFNDIHNKLVSAYAKIIKHSDYIFFTNSMDNLGEDVITTAYHMDCANEAGLLSYRCHISDIGWCSSKKEFVDLENNMMKVIFKLYPWEWLMREEFGKNILQSSTYWLEPIWKSIWSNKAILPILWELYPDHPNLLPSFYSSTLNSDQYKTLGKDIVRKPILSREGQNVSIISDGNVLLASDGIYQDSNTIVQSRFFLPEFDGVYPVIGSWCIDGYAAGMGIREDGLITTNGSMFVPHIIEG